MSCPLQVTELDFAQQTFEYAETPTTRFGLPVGNTSTILGLDPYHPMRRFVFRLVKNPLFDGIILAVILFSTVLLAMDNPTTRQSNTWVRLGSTSTQ